MLNTIHFSIIIPVYQEKKLNLFLEHLSTLNRFSETETIIVDALKQTSSFNEKQFHQVRYIISKSLGRGAQMNLGAEKAQGNFLFFLHCDSLLKKNALDEIESILTLKSYTLGCFYLKILSTKKLFRTIEYWVNWRNKNTRCPYGDQGYFLRSQDFFELGKFKEIEFFEDMEFMERLRSQKKRIYLSTLPIYTSSRKWEENGIVINTIRNLLLRFFYNIGINPNTLAKFYWKRKPKIK